MNIRYSKAFRIPRKIAKYTFSFLYPLVIRIWKLPNVKSIEETLDIILEKKLSISRYGDSEFLYIIDELNLPYQNFDKKLKDRMVEILVSKEDNLLVGLPIGYHSLLNLNNSSRVVWRSQISWIYPRLRKYLDMNKIYYNSSMTRVYIDYVDKTHCSIWFDKIKSIWEDREVVIIEGEKSRLGIGNDLFKGAKSIQRILGPAHHAFSRYNDLYSYASTFSKEKLFLIAMGPTATVLSYDLCKLGYQAIDIGNVDIEYEWFLRKASNKIKIPLKYTSEVSGGRIVEDLEDKEYESQIIAKFLD